MKTLELESGAEHNHMSGGCRCSKKAQNPYDGIRLGWVLEVE